MEHNIFKNPTQLVGDKPVGSFTSVAEDLNWKLPKTNPASGLVQRFNRSATFLRQSVFPLQAPINVFQCLYLTIIPRARMGSESIAHEGERNNCFSKIQLVGKKYRDKTTLASKTRFSRHCFGFQSRRFSLLAGYNIQPSQQLNQSERSLDNRPLVRFY